MSLDQWVLTFVMFSTLLWSCFPFAGGDGYGGDDDDGDGCSAKMTSNCLMLGWKSRKGEIGRDGRCQQLKQLMSQ